jgi:hypothetical protein
MSDLTTTIDTYLSAWNETDPARRAKLIDQVWATDGRLIDPPLASEGHAGISDHVETFHAQFPGHTFQRASSVDAHHDQFRVAWNLMSPDGTVALAGLDVGELAADGRLQRVAGFFGPAPANDTEATA